MAEYKVPQDVEADDKLIGPFTFRQFIYLLIVAAAIGISWGLSNLFLPLAIIPLPIILFFGAIALPLRKDQPMEIFMAAMVSFYLKPRKRLWDPDGCDSLVEITAPKTVEVQLTKDLSQSEAIKRLGYLAQIVDSRGWAVRGASNGVQVLNSSVNSDVYFEAQQAQDVLDDSSQTSQTLIYKLDKSDQLHHQQMIDMMQHKVAPAPKPQAQPQAPQPAIQQPTTTLASYFETPAPVPVVKPAAPTSEQIFSKPLNYNPYPEEMHQTVIQPLDVAERVSAKPAQKPQATTSEKAISADIIKLASNNDLSIEAIARNAKRIQKQQENSDKEVFISLR